MAVVASAPGKVLLTGGYLILERPNAGIVLSTNARFYALVKPVHQLIKPDSGLWGWTDVKVTSPQLSRESIYKMSLKTLKLTRVSSSETRNPFVEHAVEYAIAAATSTVHSDKSDVLKKRLLQGLDITILGCNDFYSYRNQIEAQGLPLTPEALASLPPFTSINFNVDESNAENSKPEVAKTGLGSSAAMTTAVVAAILHYLGAVNLPSLTEDANKGTETTELDLVHMIAQSAHCIAQGKVGSGFDVSSAVYGSQRYLRFSPDVLSSAQAALEGGKSLRDVIPDVLKGTWDHERTKFSLPPLMNILLGEPGTGGSSTPSMVGAVKKWQKNDPQKSAETWGKLSEANSALESELNILSNLAEDHWDAYRAIISTCSMLKSDSWLKHGTDSPHKNIIRALLESRIAMSRIRYYMRQMGEAAGIPIEPESQTRLLDTTMNMEGVLLAGVPGAGGFDAVFAVTLGDSSDRVTKVWTSLDVLALLVREDPHGVLLENDDPRAAKEITSNMSSIRI